MGIQITHQINMEQVIRSVSHESVVIDSVVHVRDDIVVVNYHGKEPNVLADKVASYILTVGINKDGVTTGVAQVLYRPIRDTPPPVMVANGDGTISIVYVDYRENGTKSCIYATHVSVTDDLDFRFNVRQYNYNSRVSGLRMTSLSESRIVVAASFAGDCMGLMLQTVDVHAERVHWNPLIMIHDREVSVNEISLIAMNENSVVVNFSELDLVAHPYLQRGDMAFINAEFENGVCFAYHTTPYPITSMIWNFNLCRLNADQIGVSYIDVSMSRCAIFAVFNLFRTGQLVKAKVKVIIQEDAYYLNPLHSNGGIVLFDALVDNKNTLYKMEVTPQHIGARDINAHWIEEPNTSSSMVTAAMSDHFLLTVVDQGVQSDSPYRWEFILTEYN